MTPLEDEILEHYASGYEESRLESGAGAIEFSRSQEILLQNLPPVPAVIYDIGGGPGRYSAWLTSLGYRVLLLDAHPLHVKQALSRGIDARVGDARRIPFDSSSAGAALLMGPLYHLQEEDQRLLALTEAHRVLKPGGVVVASAVCRYASLLDSLRNRFSLDSRFSPVLEEDLATGKHKNPSPLDQPHWFTTAYFHTADGLGSEVSRAGFSLKGVVGVEGPGWLMSDIDERMDDRDGREAIMHAARLAAQNPELRSVSAHLMAIGHKS